ncbi:MAG TPA: hypothetical protein VEK57_16870 [Thermoanaerobaculia bacterium]|nr:hypothetical protein [Thermoanaerobaculia bacterium]
MKHRSLALAILFTSILAVACREETPEEKKTTWMGTSTDTSGTAPDTASATHPASPGGTALVPEVTAGTTVLVMLNDNSIAVREQAIPPGPAVLTLENGGKDVHNLFVEGPGVSVAAGDALPAGNSSSMEVTFQPGTYTFYCPIGDHRTNGEQVQVTIAAP